MIFLIVLLLFGAKRLPELFRSFGKSIREFKKATSEIEDDIRTAMDEAPVETKPKTESAKPVESVDTTKDDSETAKTEKPAEAKSEKA